MMKRAARTPKNEKKSSFCFKLGLSGFISLAILVVIGMAWSFILGVIVGRGYQPEQMAKEMAQKVLPEDFPLLTEKNEEVLKAEELEFFDKLKQGPSTAVASTAPTPAKPAPPKPQNATAAKPENKPTAAATPPPAPTENKDEVFVFNYQVAALASMDQAQTFLKRLEPGGFKTSVVTASHEGKTWYRVYVHHQGTVESAMTLKEKLKASGVNNVLLRARTPL